MPESVAVFTADQKAAEARGQKTMDGIDNFLTKVGLINENTISASFYTFNLLTRNRIQLEAAYRGSWIVGQVIDVVAEDMTKAGINITTSKTQFDVDDFQAKISRLKIGQSLCSNTKWARLYGGSIGVIQIEGQDLSTPLDVSSIDKGQFQGIVVFDRWQLNPVLSIPIESGPDMGLPKFYDIVNDPRQQEPENFTATGQQRVHHSRCIRQVGIELPYFQAITEMMWGESELERLWDRLIAFDTTTMSVANLVEKANNRIISVEDLRSIVSAGGKALDGMIAYFDMIKTYQANEGLTLLDKNDLYTVQNYTFAGLDSVLLQFGQQLCGATNIPAVRLFGQSPAGFSATGESDIRTYYDNINSQQNSQLRGPWELILKCMWPSTYGEPLPDDVEFTFVPLWQMSALDQATVTKTNVETILGAHEAGATKLSTTMKELKNLSSDSGLFSNITDEDIADAEEADEDPPMPDETKVDPADPNQAAPTKPPVIPTPVPKIKGLDERNWRVKLKSFIRRTK